MQNLSVLLHAKITNQVCFRSVSTFLIRPPYIGGLRHWINFSAGGTVYISDQYKHKHDFSVDVSLALPFPDLFP